MKLKFISFVSVVLLIGAITSQVSASCRFTACRGVIPVADSTLLRDSQLKTEIDEQTFIKLSPTVCTNEITVRFATPVTSASVDIINLQGALVMNEKVENSEAITLYVSSLKQGMYLVKIKTSANDYDTLRFIKN
jgi:hypothetical protein